MKLDILRRKSVVSQLLVPFFLGLGILMTFSREVIIAYFYGAQRNVEIFKIAFSLPYALFQSLGTILVSGLLPVLLRRGQVYIYVIRRQIYGLSFSFLLISLFTIKWQVQWLAPGFSGEDAELLRVNLFLCWMILFFSAMIFPLRLVLQSQDRKFLVSSTSFMFSFFFIVMLVPFHNVSSPYLLSVVSVFSIAIVYIAYLLSVEKNKKEDAYLARSIEVTSADKAFIRRVVLGSLVYVVLLASPRLIDRAFASALTEGVVANLDYAMNIYTAIGVLIGTSSSIIYARKIAAEYDTEADRIRWLWNLMKWPLLISCSIILLIMPFLHEIVELAYVRGAFTDKDAFQVSQILVWFIWSLPFMVSGMLLAQVLVAHTIYLLLGVLLLKLVVKLAVLLIAGVEELSIFGGSNLLMEFSGVLIFIALLSVNKEKEKRG